MTCSRTECIAFGAPAHDHDSASGRLLHRHIDSTTNIDITAVDDFAWWLDIVAEVKGDKQFQAFVDELAAAQKIARKANERTVRST